MNTSSSGSRPFPTKDEVLAFLQESTGVVGRREIARAFHITGPARAQLRALLKELESEGHLKKGRGKRVTLPGRLPEVGILVISGRGPEGELLCRSARDSTADDPDDETPAVRIELREDRKSSRAEGGPWRVGDRFLARLQAVDDTHYFARPIRRLAQGPVRILGVLSPVSDGLRLVPTARKDLAVYRVDDSRDLEPGTFVEAELLPGRNAGAHTVRILRTLGRETEARFISRVAIETYDIPHVFPAPALEQARAAGAVDLAGREDLRAIPLVTIDGADARDFDDAVFAEPDPSPSNRGGWIVLIAIADVAHYVPPGSPLDREAFERGNSVYFPDCVVPMLPEELSNGWCSLVPGEDRGCLAVRITLDAQGEIRSHRFVRGLMRSAARLTYEQVQKARDGQPDPEVVPFLDTVIAPLYGAWEALDHARRKRGCLELELPEVRVHMNDQGQPTAILPVHRLNSHRLIEDFMIAANVSAAETLERRHEPCLFRVHDQPSPEKARGLADFLREQGLPFTKGTIKQASQFNGLLDLVRNTPREHMVNAMVLRSQAQAEYSPDNIGHFGLSLRRYAHFTSPIRRYADLTVHRALIRVLGLGRDGGEPGASLPLDEIGQHITSTERRAAQAERESVLRATALFLATQCGSFFAARVNGVSRGGLFVTLEETGADGFVPFTGLPPDYYILDESGHRLIGERSNLVFSLGDPITVRLQDVSTASGRLTFEWIEGGTVRKDGGKIRRSARALKDTRPRRGRR
ncbi:ribonuclease R [Phaeovibrio sulfidiphilus]|uniref:Ribonuclease R n=1 Tax=Phaeovibrio sulfidiphilus TaxID=1220600 RepID=A0A8J6YI67_9PROT|nr:ribonuclease R [Phaeovibrio sulfidiphilus]MBE1236696.1 ribonuclease R [Phaeovibrio sulfidiphilus]